MFQTLGRESFIASEKDYVEIRKTGTILCGTITLRHPFHVAIYGNQRRIVGQCNRAHSLVGRSFGEHISMIDYGVPEPIKYTPDRIRHPRIK